MAGPRVLYLLLAVVAAAAAVLSFAALRDLALVCGFALNLAWLLPVVVDAGAAAGSLVWLGGRVAPSARQFARALALALLGLSVAANALGHGLEAFRLAPAWWVVVIVAAVAPAVLGAVVHLAVLVSRPATTTTAEQDDVHEPHVEHGHEPVREPAGDPSTERTPAEVVTPSVAVPPAAVRPRTARRASGRGRPAPRRLLPEFVTTARAALDSARAQGDPVEPTPSWVRQVTGCSAGTAVKVAATLRTPAAAPATSRAADRQEVAA